MTIEEDIARHVVRHHVGGRETARSEHRAHRLVVYAEAHAGHARKAEFLARVFRESSLRYHASEAFLNTEAYGRAVDTYLRGRSRASALPSMIRPFAPVLDVVAADTARRGVVFAGSPANSGRDARIRANFQSSMTLHRRAGRFTSREPGQFLMGAEHGARLPHTGGDPTTTQLLLRDGLDVGVVRLIVDVRDRSRMTAEGMVLTPHEVAYATEIASGRTFDLVPILRRAAGGDAIGLAITGAAPFTRIRPRDASGSRPYDAYFDAIVFLP